MKDHLVIATAAEDSVRIYAALTTDLVESARQIHDTWPTATAAFGRVLTGTIIMGVMSDNPYRLTVDLSGSGPIGKVLAVSNCRGTVKGYAANPHVDLDLNPHGKLDVAGAMGQGYMTVIKDLGLKEPYQGIVPLQTGEIAEDFAYYFTKSEQTPSAVALGVLVNPNGRVKVAGGLIVQLMPGCAEKTMTMMESKVNRISGLTKDLDAGVTPVQFIKELTADLTDVKYLEELVIRYQCDCSRERFRGPLLSLGRAELTDIFNERGEVEVRCHFCNNEYHYQENELFS